MTQQPTASEMRALRLAVEAKNMGLDPEQITVGKVTITLRPDGGREPEIDWRK